MLFFMIIDDPQIALFATKNGVDRLFVDLEYMGKDARQGGLDTWKSRQTAVDVTRMRTAAPEAHLLVRVNPLHDGSAQEVDDVIARGADSVMLPMFYTLEELGRFLDMVDDRAEVVPLVETKAALDAVPKMASQLPLTRVHIGLNDLHLDMGMAFMFEPIAEGVLEEAAGALRSNDIAFGIGGLARAKEGIVSPEYLLGEHVRLGSDAAILSRTFHRGSETLEALQSEMDFAAEVNELRKIYRDFGQSDVASLEKNQAITRDRIRDVVQLIQRK